MKKKYSLFKKSWMMLVLISSFAFAQTNTWKGASGTAAQRIDWNTAGNWSQNRVPLTTDNVIIPNVTDKPTISGISAVCNSLTINSGGALTLANTASSLLNIKGDFTNNGTLTAGLASTVTFDGAAAAAIAGSSTSNFANLVINKNNAATTVSNGVKAFSTTGNLTVTQGNLILTAIDAYYMIKNNLTVAVNGTLTHHVNSDLQKLLLVSGHLDFSGTYSYGTYKAEVRMDGVNKTIKANTNTAQFNYLTMTNTSGTISAASDLVINDNFWPSINTVGGTFATGPHTIHAKWALFNAGGTLLINGGTLNVTQGLHNGFSSMNGTVNFTSGTLNADIVNVGDGTRTGTFNHTGGIANIGNLTINATLGNSYNCTGAQTINISENWTNNRTFAAATSTVNFTGAVAQTMNGNLSGTTGGFYNLTFNGAGATANATIDVTNTLTMTKGILTTTNPVNVTRNAVNAITGGSATSFVSGPVKWSIAGSGNTIYTFPVGKGTTYLPFVLTNVTAPTGTPTAQAEAFDMNSGGTADFSTIGTLSTTEYWSLVTSGTFPNSSVSLSRPTAIAPLDIIGGSATKTGTYTSLLGTVGPNGITNSSPIGTNKFFAFGRHEIRTSAIPGSPFCIGSTGTTVSVPFTIAGAYSSGNIFTAQLSNASGSFASPVNIGSLTGTASGTISGTIPVGTAAGTGYRIRVVSNRPDVVVYDNGVNLTVNANNTAGAASSTPTLCIHTALSAITHTTTGATGIGASSGLPAGVAATWSANKITISGTPTASGTFNYSIPLTGGCGTVNATGTITVMASGTIVLTSGSGTDNQSLCTSASLSPIKYSTSGFTGANFTGLPAGVTGIWNSNVVTISGTPSVSGSFNYTVNLTGGCSTLTATGTITVNATPVITLTKADETCPADNNGSIASVLSGGLTNIRYIKLTQKYVNPDAWQQVQEIQAFEIFTGTNVSLASNGATATASSVYLNDIQNYGPLRAIDGDSSNSFWHSNSPNVGEYIVVDLKAGKNLKNLRIYNRSSYGERGQNMLLELFDASNKLVYSKTIDLWGGVNGPHSVNVNILNVSWADNAAVLNRTGLDAGTYTLNYADAAGCSASSSVTVGTTNIPSTAPTDITGNTTICKGASTTLTVSGGSAGSGAVAQWFTNSCGGTLIGTGNSINVSPTANTIYYVRYSGTCNTTACISVAVTVRSDFGSGTIDNTGQTICAGGIPTAIGSITPASGGDGVITYSWRSSADGYVAAIGGATGAVCTPPPGLTVTTGYRRYAHDASCTTTPMVSANTWTVTIASENTAGTPSSSPILCVDATPANITITTTGATGIGTATGLPAGISASWASNIITITGTPTASGTFNYNIPLTGGCGTVNATGTMTVHPKSVAGTVSGNQNICSGSFATMSISGNSGTVQWQQSANGTTGWTSISGATSSSYTTPNLTATTYYQAVVTSGICSSVPSSVVKIAVDEVSTYNSTGWSHGLPNNNGFSAVITTSYTTADGSFSACNCTVNSGITLTVAAGTSATVINHLINNGNVMVENDGNFVQVNNWGTYTGAPANFVVKRNARMKRLDYTYWTSPVKNQNLKTFSPGTVATRFLTYNEGDDFFYPITPADHIFGDTNAGVFESAAKGYAIRANNSYPVPTQTNPHIQTFAGTFKGEPNNGLISFPLQYKSLPTGQGYNLIGNPYASNIDFRILADENADNIGKKAYFWTNLNPNPEMQGSGYPGEGYVNNYATLIAGVGGIPATTGGPVGGDPELESITPTPIIKVGQGFIVQAKKANRLIFNNGMRSTSSASVFFNKGAQDEAIDRYWIHLATPLHVITTALVAYKEDATDGYDLDYDADLFGLGSDALFTVADEHRLGIQSRQGPLQTNDIVQIGTNHYAPGVYTFSLGKKEGIFDTGQNIYLKDLQEGTLTNLSEGSYTFNAAKGLTEARFQIVYEPGIVLGTGSSVKESLVVYRTGNDFAVQAPTRKITGVEVYDTGGRLIYTAKCNSTQVLIPAAELVNGVYVLKIKQDGKITTKKIIR